MDLLAAILDCKREACVGGNCHADLKGLAGQIVVLDLDCVKMVTKHRGRICDYGVLWKNRNLVAAIELKGGTNLVINRLVEQLQGGLNALSELVGGQTVEAFYPILLFRGKIPVESLAGKRVKFRGTPRRIIAHPCGTRLSAIIKQVGKARARRRR